MADVSRELKLVIVAQDQATKALQQLGVQLGNITRQMVGAQKTAGGFSAVQRNVISLGAAFQVLTPLLTAARSAFTALERGFNALLRPTIIVADQMLQLGRRVGASAAQMSRLAYQYEGTGVAVDQLGVAVKGLNASLVEAAGKPGSDAARTLRALGIEGAKLKEILGKSTAERLNAVVEAFRKFGDSPERMAGLTTVFKKAATDINQVLNSTRTEMSELADFAGQAGAIVSDAQGQAANNALTAWRKVTIAVEGFMRSTAGAPRLIQAVADVATRTADGILAVRAALPPDAVERLQAVLVRVAEALGAVVVGMVQLSTSDVVIGFLDRLARAVNAVADGMQRASQNGDTFRRVLVGAATGFVAGAPLAGIGAIPGAIAGGVVGYGVDQAEQGTRPWLDWWNRKVAAPFNRTSRTGGRSYADAAAAAAASAQAGGSLPGAPMWAPWSVSDAPPAAPGGLPFPNLAGGGGGSTDRALERLAKLRNELTLLQDPAQRVRVEIDEIVADFVDTPLVDQARALAEQLVRAKIDKQIAETLRAMADELRVIHDPAQQLAVDLEAATRQARELGATAEQIAAVRAQFEATSAGRLNQDFGSQIASLRGDLEGIGASEAQLAAVADHFAAIAGSTPELARGIAQLRDPTAAATQAADDLARKYELLGNVSMANAVRELGRLRAETIRTQREAGAWLSFSATAEKAIDDVSEALVSGTLNWGKVVQSFKVDFAHSFFTAFKEGIKHKLGFDRDFSVNIAGLMKNAGEVIAGNRGLGSIFEGVFKDSAAVAAQGSQAIAASTTAVPAAAVQAAQTGTQALAAVGDQAVQTAATVSQAGTLAQGGWAGFFSFLLSSGQSAFGGLMQLAQAFLSMLTGSGSGGAGILNAIGSLAGLATGGRAGGSGGGWLDMISTGLGLAGGLWSGAKTLFSGTGVGTWLEGIAGSGLGQSVGQLFGLASSGAGLVSGVMGLANGNGNWLGNILNTVQVLSGLTGVVGNVSQLAGFGAVPLSQGGIALMQGGQVSGILGANGLTTIEGGAALAQVGTPGGLFSLAQSGLSALASSPMVQAVVQTFQSALGPIFEAVKAIVTTVTNVVAPIVAPTVGAAVGAVAPGAAAAVGGAASSVAPALGVLGGLAGMALGIKGAIEAPTTQGKVGNSLVAAGSLIAIVVPVLGIIIAIIGAILAATQNIDIRQMTRKEYGKQLSRVMGRWVDTNLYHQVGEGVRDKAALGRMREHRPEFVIAGLMGMGAMGAASMNRPDMSLEFTRMMMNNAAIAGYSEEQLAKLFRRNVIHFGGSLYGGVGLGGEALKSWRRQYGRPDADRMAVLTEGWRRTGNLFSDNAAGVMVGDIFARHIAPSGRVDLKGAAVEIRRAVLQAIEMGAEFTRRDAKRLGDPFLRAFLQMVKKLPSVIDVLKLAQAVVASDTPGSARAMIRRLKRVVGYETALVAAGLELPADMLAEAAEEVPGRKRKQKRNVRARTATLVSLARLETARNDALLAIQYGPEAAQVAASDRDLKAAQLAVEQADKTLGKKHVSRKKRKQAQEDLDQATQQAQQAADSWRQAVTGILNGIVQLDAKLRESKLAFAEEIAQLRDQKIATTVYTAALADNAARMAKATTAATKAALIEERMALLRRQAQADLANLQKDLDQVAPLAQLSAGIKSQIADIRNAGRSPRALLGDVQDQLARAQDTFRTAKDGGERAAAAQEIQQLVARSMELAADAFGGSSGRARAVRDAGLVALGEIGDAAQAAADEAKRLQDQMKKVNQVLADRLELEQTALVSAMKAMRADLVTKLQEALPGQNVEDLLADPIAAQTIILAESDKKLADIRDILARRGGIADGGAQANGGDYIVRRPTLFLAGEAGPERATFTPMRGGRRVANGGGATIQINASVTVAPAPGEKPARAMLYGRVAADALEAQLLERVNHGELGRRLRGVM